MKRILVTTMGTTWQVIPELLGFTNPALRIYQSHPEKEKIAHLRTEYSIEPVDEIRIITTGGETTDDSVEKATRWLENKKISHVFYRGIASL